MYNATMECKIYFETYTPFYRFVKKNSLIKMVYSIIITDTKFPTSRRIYNAFILWTSKAVIWINSN